VWRGVGRGELLQSHRQHVRFAKVDVTFGEDIDGIGGKAGMNRLVSTVTA